jgi:hypothetical protein
MGARWFSAKTPQGTDDLFILRLRHDKVPVWKAGDWKPTAWRMDNVHIFDAQNVELKNFTLHGSWVKEESPSYPFVPTFSLQPNGEIVVSLFGGLTGPVLMPEGGWASYQQPLRVEADISDGTCWPFKMRAHIEREEITEGELGRFGLPRP